MRGIVFGVAGALLFAAPMAGAQVSRGFPAGPADRDNWSATQGRTVGADRNGRAAVDWGVYGVPESFLVDGKGIIRLKWIGPLSREALGTQIIPEIEELRRGGGS